MRNLAKYEVNHVRNSPELWAEFRADYLKLFGETIRPNCKSKYIEKFKKLVMEMKKEPKKAVYLLKAKYNGIRFKGKLYRNGDLTDTQAKFLLKNHPAKENLFEKLPTKEK